MKKGIIAAVVIGLTVVLGAIIFIASLPKEEITEYNPTTLDVSTEPTEKWQEGAISYNGKQYKFNNKIKTYLFLGIDNDEPVSKAKDGISGGQSDAIFLLVEDTEKEEFSIIAINRNTMTMVDVYDTNGDYMGQVKLQLCLQHGYGDGMKTSCNRTVDTVSRLFYNLPINGYMSINMGAIDKMNDSIGGVEVTVLDDLQDKSRGVDLKKGETKVLNGNEAYVYLRKRDVDEFNSASFRMERQKQYLTSFFKKAAEVTKRDQATVLGIYHSIEEYLVSNIDFADFLSEAAEYEFPEGNMYTVQGEMVMGEEFEEFYVDEEALYDMIINVFYKEVE